MKTVEERKEYFIKRAKEVHTGENLDYSKVEYKDNRTPVCIIDHDLKPDGTEYGEFWQTPSNHLKGQTHPLKKGERISKNRTRMTTELLIERFKQAHPDVDYDYSKVVYKGMHEKVCIIDPVYGEFWQEANSHLRGHGHKSRGIEESHVNDKHMYKKGFEERARKVHGNKYIYMLDDDSFATWRSKVDIVCPIHGKFTQTVENHLGGKGCPACGNRNLSKCEDEISSILSEACGGLNIIRHDRTTLDGSEIDIYIPDKKLAIEYDGLYWHTEWSGGKGRRYHLSKTEAAKSKGINLIHIFEDEYQTHKELVISKLLNKLGHSGSKSKIGARNCIIKTVSNETANDFLDKYHIQGHSDATVYYGAFYNSVLVGVMTFKKCDEKGETWDLNRYATNIEYICQGLGSKIFNTFAKKFQPKTVKSFADRRWTTDPSDNLYIRMGFHLDCVLNPDYRYYDHTHHTQGRLHKFMFRKEKLHKKYGFPLEMTETEMVRQLGYDRIWDCGLYRFVWTRDSEKRK